MERYNPFANEPQFADDQPPLSPSKLPRTPVSTLRSTLSSSLSSSPPPLPPPPLTPQLGPTSSLSHRYTTSFPDPFADATTSDAIQEKPKQEQPAPSPSNRSNSVTFPQQEATSRDPGAAPTAQRPAMQRTQTTAGSGSAGVGGASGRQSGTFTSFLSRATSVTSTTVTDRVSGAVGTVRSAVDSISNQIQQAVPGGFVGSGDGPNEPPSSPSLQSQQQQSATSYLTSKLSSGAGNPVGQQMSLISRQRVVLILDSLASADWAQQFHSYRRLLAGSTSGGGGAIGSASASLTSFFASQFSQLASSSSAAAAQVNDGSDLIEQVNFRDISVLANQSSCMAAIYVCGSSSSTAPTATAASTASQLLFKSTGPAGQSSSSSGSQSSAGNSFKIIRPEFVIVRERCKDKALDHLRGIVKALSYSLVPMFEPYEIWDTFQDKQLIFSKLIRVRTKLGKEQFPLIPQIYCQTYQDLLNYINNSQIKLPCLVRTGHLGKGKIKIDSIQMLKDFASIMATSGQSCTIEQYLDVKYDLVVQRLGTSLKLFRRMIQKPSNESFHLSGAAVAATATGPLSSNNTGSFQFDDIFGQKIQYYDSAASKQPASRQTSLGAGVGVLSNLIGSTQSQQQQQQQQQQLALSPSDRRRSSGMSGGVGGLGGGSYERLSEVGARYKNWVEAVSREFDNKLEVLCIKIVVATNDREYIVGLRNCSMDFLGNQENQDEDRRSFVELILTRMNTILPKHSPASRESSLNTAKRLSFEKQQQQQQQSSLATTSLNRRTSSGDDNYPTSLQHKQSLTGSTPVIQTRVSGQPSAKSKPTFMSQSDIQSASAGAGRGFDDHYSPALAHSYGHQLSNRSKSVSINQASGDSLNSTTPPLSDQRQTTNYSGNNNNKSSPLNYADSRNSIDDNQPEDGDAANQRTGGQSHQRQSSLGQSFLDQTSTAFSSLQKQSLSFLKRLDSTRADQMFGGSGGPPPPLAAKSEAFDRLDYKGGHSASGGSTYGGGAANKTPGAKSQSIDSSSLDNQARSPRRETPPKPPPPHSFMNRQSSLATYSSQGARSSSAKRLSDVTTTPNTTPTTSRQNSSALRGSDSSESNGNAAAMSSSNDPAATSAARNRVIRQNSALSAFEPFDPDLRVSLNEVLTGERPSDVSGSATALSFHQKQQQQQQPSADVSILKHRVGSSGNIDTGSITSGDSGSTNETTTAEDTMNNLKKTFASIFGDKCD